jgi:hypothetical protein
MKNKNRVFLIGGGSSVLEGISSGLWDKLKDENVWSLNFAHKTMPYLPSTEVWIDRQFFVDNVESLQNLHKQGVKLITASNSKYNSFPEIQTYQTTRNVQNYLGKKMIEQNKVFVGTMGQTGFFALSLAICMGFDSIFLCFDNKTEVFTNKGWKYFKDLNGNELILTRKYNGETEWSPILNYIEKNYKGIMYKIKSRNIDLLVTPEHKFPLLSNKYKYNDYLWKKIKNFKKNTTQFIPRTFIWKGKEKKYFILPTINKKEKDYYSNKIHKIKMTSWVKFLGLYLSEGCISINNGNYKITIYQNHSKEKDEYIENILKNLPFHYKKHKRGWIIYSKQLIMYLKQFGKSKDKFIPREILNLEKKYLEQLLNSLIFGDGSIGKNGKLWYYTSSKQLADDVQEIAYKCNYYAEIYYNSNIDKKTYLTRHIKPSWCVYINNSKKQGNGSKISVGNLVFKNNIKKNMYNGKIYDITVKNHTLWVRRNNKCCWSGNCGFDFGTPYYKADTTHYYQDRIQELKIISKGVGKHDVYYNNEGKLKSGISDYEVYTLENVSIYNVSLISNIKCFPKINYKIMYELIGENNG